MMPEGARVRVLGGFSSESEAPLSQLTRVACDSVVLRALNETEERAPNAAEVRKCGNTECR
jgi:hypothetical protein